VSRQAAEARGRRGEWIAAWWLRLHGWRILAQRVRVHGGEVDLVARRGRILAMVEVKSRNRAEDLATAIDARRLKRVAAAAAIIAPRYLRTGDDVRIDVMLISGGWRVTHLPHVWQP
jgi:putative endonuclease